MSEPDYSTIAGWLFPTAGTTWVEKTLERLRNNPEALAAMRLKTFEEVNEIGLEWQKSSVASRADVVEKLAAANERIKELEAELQDLKESGASMALRYTDALSRIKELEEALAHMTTYAQQGWSFTRPEELSELNKAKDLLGWTRAFDISKGKADNE